MEDLIKIIDKTIKKHPRTRYTKRKNPIVEVIEEGLKKTGRYKKYKIRQGKVTP